MKLRISSKAAIHVITTALSLAIAHGHAVAQATAAEEPWFFTLEGMVSGPLNDRPQEQYGVGGGGDLGAYGSLLPELALGLRLGAGALWANGTAPGGAFEWGALSAVVRLRPLGSMQLERRASGLWIELGAGPWLVEGGVDPVFDATVGYGIDAGPVVIGPFARFTHVAEAYGRYGTDAILLGSLGVELAWNDVMAQPVVPAPAERPAIAVVEAPAPLPPEQDVTVPFVNDQLIIDERVFFDFDSWELRPTGADQLGEVVRRYEESGDAWAALVISAHTDRRGAADYNVQLSRKRAETVRIFLTSRGIPDAILEIQAWGETQPEIADATIEYEHQVNRRVQFEIVWREGMRPEGIAPAPSPSEPDYVDEAPADRAERP